MKHKHVEVVFGERDGIKIGHSLLAVNGNKVRIESGKAVLENDGKDVFEVCRCAVWIKRHNFHNTTLQFPDHLLQYAPIVAKQIGKESERR